MTSNSDFDLLGVKMEVQMEEYKTLRNEILQCMVFRISIVTLGITGIGFLFGLAATEFSNDHFFTSGLLLILGLPVNRFVISWWLAESKRLRRAGYYICQLEQEVNKKLDDNTLRWESSFLRGSENSEKKVNIETEYYDNFLYKLIRTTLFESMILSGFLFLFLGIKQIVEVFDSITPFDRLFIFYMTYSVFAIIVLLYLIFRLFNIVKKYRYKRNKTRLFQDHYLAVISIYVYMFFISVLGGMYTLLKTLFIYISKESIFNDLHLAIIGLEIIVSFILSNIYYNFIYNELKIFTDKYDKKNLCKT